MTEDLPTRARAAAERIGATIHRLNGHWWNRRHRPEAPDLRIVLDAITTLTAERDAALARVEADGWERVRYEAQFLIARIDDLDWCDFERFANDWSGHVDPPLSRLRDALAALAPPSGAMDREEGANG